MSNAKPRSVAALSGGGCCLADFGKKEMQLPTRNARLMELIRRYGDKETPQGFQSHGLAA